MNLALFALLLVVASVVLFLPLYYIMSTALEESTSKRSVFLMSAGISSSFGSSLFAAWTPKVLRVNSVGLSADVVFFVGSFILYSLVVVSLFVASILHWRRDGTPS